MSFEAFGPFTMTAKKFFALMPHERTEMALLVRERFVQEGCLRQLHHDIVVYCDLEHQYSIPSPNVPVRQEDGLTDRLASKDLAPSGYPRLAASIIKAIYQERDGTLQATRSDIAARFSVAVSSASNAMNLLIDEGLIKRVGRKDRWTLTVKAHRLLDVILASGGAV